MTSTAIHPLPIDFMHHIETLERAQNIVVLIKRATEKSDRKAIDALTTPFERLQQKYAHQSVIAARAAQRLSKYYERILIDLLVS